MVVQSFFICLLILRYFRNLSLRSGVRRLSVLLRFGCGCHILPGSDATAMVAPVVYVIAAILSDASHSPGCVLTNVSSLPLKVWLSNGIKSTWRHSTAIMNYAVRTRSIAKTGWVKIDNLITLNPEHLYCICRHIFDSAYLCQTIILPAVQQNECGHASGSQFD